MGELIHGDCLDVMRGMKPGSVDLVVTSPPYNLGMNGAPLHSRWSNAELKDGYDSHPDSLPHNEYVEWQRNCLAEMMKMIPENGAIFYNHKWRIREGILDDRSDILSGFPVRQILIWQRAGGLNFTESHFLPTYEVIYLIAKSGFRLRKKSSNLGDIWKINQSHQNDHPAPFPVALPQRCIDATDARVVLDPFMGSGTTAIASIRAGRGWIGIEKSAKYCQMAKERIAVEERRQSLFTQETMYA